MNPLFEVVLVEPEIPPNTGNVIRLCANTGARLHLIEPLGFAIDDRQLRRAGLDYHEFAELQVHRDWPSFIATRAPDRSRMFALTTHGSRSIGTVQFAPGDILVFGCETRGLNPALRAEFPLGNRLRLPMRPGNRSLNLSNAVAVTVYEAWRQQAYAGAADKS